VADAFASAHPEFEAASFADPFAEAAAVQVRVVWEPQVSGGNGMFVAVWRKRA
jgi:hypothetical protein